jgi:hypothetical protein
VSTTTLRGEDRSALAVRTIAPAIAVRVDEHSSTPGIFYVGKAPIGTTAATARWQMCRITVAAGAVAAVIIDWADGNDYFDNVYTNRQSLSYS